MKRYRVTYRISDNREDEFTRTDQVYADGWRVDNEVVSLYLRQEGQEVPVFDVPKSRVMRIHEVGN